MIVTKKSTPKALAKTNSTSRELLARWVKIDGQLVCTWSK